MGCLVIARTPHAINGKRLGTFYRFADGRGLYLAHVSGERPRCLDTRRNAWLMEYDALRQAQLRGCGAVGIAHRVGKHVTYYVTALEDMLDHPSERVFGAKTLQRRLARDRFRVNTALHAGNIARAMRLR